MKKAVWVMFFYWFQVICSCADPTSSHLLISNGVHISSEDVNSPVYHNPNDPFVAVVRLKLKFTSRQQGCTPQFHSCSGVVISSTVLITAAHCLAEHKVNQCSYQVNKTTDIFIYHDGKRINPHRFVIHPLFKSEELSQNMAYDVALIEVSQPVSASFKPFHSPVTIDFTEYPPLSNIPMTLVGWGNSSYYKEDFFFTKRMGYTEAHLDSKNGYYEGLGLLSDLNVGFESSIINGDSGGGWFANGKLMAISSQYAIQNDHHAKFSGTNLSSLSSKQFIAETLDIFARK